MLPVQADSVASKSFRTLVHNFDDRLTCHLPFYDYFPCAILHSMNFQQTHFVGVLVPTDIEAILEDCRRHMHQRYGCRSGHGTPVHVTLVPPFLLPGSLSTRSLVQAIQSAIHRQELPPPFTATVSGFDAFGDRTIFAEVEPDERWSQLRDSVLVQVLALVPGCIRRDRRPFRPHLTVANRDIPAGASTEALEVLSGMGLHDSFPVDNITIFERRGRQWIDVVTLEL